MKKAAIFLLLNIYTVATFGIGINSYYCCGKLRSVTVSLIEQKDATCSKNAAPSCCNTRHQFLKIHDSHLAATGFFYFSGLPVLDLPATRVNGIRLFASMIQKGTHAAHAPPPLSSCPLYILHSDYRI
jgi:hypothetical protein